MWIFNAENFLRLNKMNDKKKIIEQFLKLHSEGENIKSLCSRFGICKSTAYNWIREYTPIRKPYKGRIITPTDYRKLECAKHTLQIENEIFHRSGILSKIPLDDKFAIIENLSSDFSIHILYKTRSRHIIITNYAALLKSGMKLMMKCCVLL